MRVLLAMMARRGREPFLDEILSVVGPSFESVEILYDDSSDVTDFSRARNQLIHIGESKGYDWIFMLDADGCMFPEDILRVRCLMREELSLIVLPRIEMVRDRRHWDPMIYPDYQGRVFRLGSGLHFRNRIHEQLYRRFGVRSEFDRGNYAVCDTAPIYHYGQTKDVREVLLKNLNYERLSGGEPLLSALPEGLTLDDRSFWPSMAPFDHPHPLDGQEASASCASRGGVASGVMAKDLDHLQRHAEFLAVVAAYPGRLLEVCAGSDSMSRYLAECGHAVVGVRRTEENKAAASDQALRVVGVSYEVCDPNALARSHAAGSFALAYSEGFFQCFDDDEIRMLLAEQLRVADAVVFSVPSDRHLGHDSDSGRFLSPAEWQAIVAPVAQVQVRYYGLSLLPLRQAVSARIKGTLRQDGQYVMVSVRSST